jgi:hypothetical protein
MSNSIYECVCRSTKFLAALLIVIAACLPASDATARKAKNKPTRSSGCFSALPVEGATQGQQIIFTYPSVHPTSPLILCDSKNYVNGKLYSLYVSWAQQDHAFLLSYDYYNGCNGCTQGGHQNIQLRAKDKTMKNLTENPLYSSDIGRGKCWYEPHESRIQNHQFDDRGLTPSTVKYLEVRVVNGGGKQTRC